MGFKSFIESKKQLEENSLYKDANEKTVFLSDKKNVAEAFLYNFFGMLGLMSGISPKSKSEITRLNTYLKGEQKVQIQNITDENNDLSLVVKHAKDAGFFKNDLTVTNITKFLAKTKMGQVDNIDSKIVAGWVNDLTPAFFQSIRDAKARKIIQEFAKDGGENIDISRLAVDLKKRANRVTWSGDFKRFSKTTRIREKMIGANAAATDGATATTTAAPKAVKPAAPVVPDAPPAPPPKPTTINKKINLADSWNDTGNAVLKYLLLAGTAFQDAAERALRTNLEYQNVRGNKVYTKDEVELVIEKLRQIGPTAHRMFSLNVHDVPTAMANLKTELDNTGLFIGTGSSNDLATAFKGIAWPEQMSKIYDFQYLKPLILYLAGKFSEATQIASADRLKATLDFIANSNLGNKANYSAKVFLENMTYRSIVEGSYTYNTITTDATKQAQALFISAKMQIAGDKLETVIDDGWRMNEFIGEVFQYLTDLQDEKIDGYSMLEGFTQEIERAIRSPQDYPEFMKLVGKSIQRNVLQTIRGPDKVHPLLFTLFDKVYKQDLLDKGLSESKFQKADFEVRFKKYALQRWSITYDELKKKFPEDRSVTALKVEAEGTDKVSAEELSDYAEYNAYNTIRNYRRYGSQPNSALTFEEATKTPGFSAQVMQNYKGLYNRSLQDTSSLAKAVTLTMDRYPQNFDNSVTFQKMMHLFQGFEKEGTLGIIRTAKKHNFKSFFDANIYKDTSRRAEKEEFVSILTSVMNDAIGTDVEDYFSDIVETMPGTVIGKIRNSLIGFNKLVDEVNKGEIQPFGQIDDKRLRTMLMMNDINPNALISGEAPRRKRNEKYTDYFKRVKEELEKKSGSSVLGKEKVELDSKTDVKELTRSYNKNFRTNNNHGDTYVKVLKTYTSNFKHPEFDEFRKNNFGDGTITPAFHGTGGIAASMILRYGFKVIKDSDPSVVGRMLGNGIYFSNKIDKALQYIGNSGYGRSIGTKGYLIEVDNTLGKKDLSNSYDNPDYRVMGLGNDHIRSPEWCVRDPKKQLAIIKVHEVEFSNKRLSEEYAGSLNESESRLGFKEFMSESKLLKMKNNVASFTFRDGLIPILQKNGDLDFIDFEDVITQKLMPTRFIDYSRNGPVVVFHNAKKNEGFDLRYADLINGAAYASYIENFKREVLNK